MLLSHSPDFVSILKSKKASTAYMFVHFEAPRPSSVYFVEMVADDAGKLQATGGKNMGTVGTMLAGFVCSPTSLTRCDCAWVTT